MKAKEVILLIFIVLVGVFFSRLYNEELEFEADWGKGWLFGYEEFVFEESQILESPALNHLHVLNSHGSVEVRGTDKSTVSVTFEKRIWRKNEADAREVANKLEMTIDQDGPVMTISNNRQDFKKKSFETYYSIEVPEGIKVNITNSLGPVKAERVGDTDITNRYGEIIALEIDGTLTISNSYDEVSIEDISSDCTIEGVHADINILNVSGTVDIKNIHAKLTLEEIEKEVTIRSPHSRIYGWDITGNMDIENSYEKIELSDVGTVKITGDQSPVQIDGADGDIDINNRYSKVRLKNIRGSIFIEGKDLGIFGNTVHGEKITIHSTYDDIELEQFSGETSITLAHGKIYLTPSPLIRPLEIRGSHADIKFFWPESGTYPIDIQAKQGQILWKLDSAVSSQKDNGLSVVKAFTDESGKPSIFLSTEYGTVSVEKSIVI